MTNCVIYLYPNRTMTHKESTLHVFCREGNYEQISQFIKTCEDLPSQLACYQGLVGYTPLHEAASSGHLNVLELLLQHGSDVNCLTNTGCTPLHLAAINGHLNSLKLLLHCGSFVNFRTNSGHTPLHLAASGHHTDCIMLLLAYGADDSIVDENRKRPLQISKYKDQKKLINSIGKQYSYVHAKK